MKYFFDTEFIEGFKKPIKWLPTIGKFNKPYHSIQLISIGVICEDGRQYYAISNEFNASDASDWVKENVIKKLDGPDSVVRKPNKQIAFEICQFIDQRYLDDTDKSRGYIYPCDSSKYPHEVETVDISFYAYYADYDWVVFCSLFGTMMDLPKGFPKYCRDLKQMIDSHCESGSISLNDLKSNPSYPKQENEHDALYDAKWNYELYEFIQQFNPVQSLKNVE